MIENMRERDRTGRKKYGVPLQAGNGRKPLVDAYQEKLDECVYIRQEIEERKALEAKVARLERELAEAQHQIGELLYRAHRYDDKPHQIYSHIMVMAKGHPDEAEIRRLMDLRYNGCHDEKKDAEALRALAAWLAKPDTSSEVLYNTGRWICSLRDRDCETFGTGATLAAAIMDAISKAQA